MLTKLKNGSWIDLTTVRSISPCKEEKGFSVPCGPRVIVRSHDNVEVVYFAFMADAETYAAELAEKANEQSEKRNADSDLLKLAKGCLETIKDENIDSLQKLYRISLWCRTIVDKPTTK